MNRTHLTSLLLSLSMSAPVLAQGTQLHFPANDPAGGACASVPFDQAVGSKLQMLFTAAELGNAPLRIDDLAFAPCGTGTYTVGRFQVRMKHVTGPLTNDFVTNIGGGATTVLDNTATDWHVVADTWVDVALTHPFAYDPSRGDLLVELRLTNTTFQGTTLGAHDHARTCLFVHGFAGAPPRTGTLAATGPRLRLSSGVAALTRSGRGCGPGPLRIDANHAPQLGTSFDLSLSGGNPSPNPSLAVILVGFDLNPRGLGAAGMLGCTLYQLGLVNLGVVVRSGASNVAPVPVPNDPSIAGIKLYLQGANLHPGATALGVTTSDYLAATIGS